MSYTGRERRKSQVVATANAQYHLRGMVCVAVHDSHTGAPVSGHPALGSRVTGRLALSPAGVWELVDASIPQVGERLFFSSQLVTAPIAAINRSR